MTRNNQLLAVLLVFQLGLAAFLLWPRNATVAASALLPAVKIENVNKVSISDATKTIQLAKSGDQWVLPERGDFEALEPSVTDLISKALQINSGRLVATNVANFSQLKVADNDFNQKLEFSTSDGQSYALLVGTAPNTRSTNVRLAGKDEVYVTDKLSSTDVRTDYAAYVNTAYYSADADRIIALAFSNANTSLDASKDISGTWQMNGLQAGETLSTTAFTSVPSKLINLSFSEPMGKEAKPEYGFDAPQAIITITVRPAADVTDTTAVPEVTTLTVGATAGTEGNYYVKSSASDYYVKMNTFSLQDFVQKKREDYVVASAFTPLLIGDTFTDTLSSPVTGTVGLTETALITATSELTATEPVTATEPITTTEVVTP